MWSGDGKKGECFAAESRSHNLGAAADHEQCNFLQTRVGQTAARPALAVSHLDGVRLHR